MKTVNSLSGGKTSSYIAANYPADYDVFSLVRIEDESCRFKDEKIRKEVEDRLQASFVGTAEDDTIVYTMLDLEQYIGRPITWVTGPTFDELIKQKGDYLPSYMRRFCTTELKTFPIAQWRYETIQEDCVMRFGFRANEMRRANKMTKKLNEDGKTEVKIVVGKHKNGNNKWKTIEYCTPEFPLIKDNIYKDQIELYWSDKPVRFATWNNCVGCFHQEVGKLKRRWQTDAVKMEWFAKKERNSKLDATWRTGVTYDKIKEWNPSFQLFDEDYECDSGYCGL